MKTNNKLGELALVAAGLFATTASAEVTGFSQVGSEGD